MKKEITEMEMITIACKTHKTSAVQNRSQDPSDME